MEACLGGETLDRPPVALWRHFPVDDQNPGNLAAATVDFQSQYDFDFVKVTPASSFCLKDWGVEDTWEGNNEGTRVYQRRVIHQPDDWLNLKPLDPRQGWLGAQIECLKMIKSSLPDTPIIQTVFSPLAQAKNLAGGNLLLVHMRQHPEAVQQGLKTITETTRRFVEEVMNIGVDGIFYAVQHGSYALLSREEYITFGRATDLEIIEAASGGWLNLLHLHGTDIMFELFLNYPVEILNWHDRETPPSLAEALVQFGGAVCGGLRQWETMVMGDPGRVKTEALAAIKETRGQRFILGTGCVTPIVTPRANILAARQAVEY
jgi:uroporphyrinogen decarboxylase